MEEWKDFHRYKVSNLGRVKSLYGKGDKMLKPDIDKDGYETLRLHNAVGSDKKKTKMSVSRIVALTFIPNPENKETVDHINRVRTDNRVENLRWATTKEQNFNRVYANKSGYKYIRQRGDSFHVEIYKHYIGAYKSLEDAINARDDFFRLKKIINL